uniref:hypothetical protein n=1 Tax=Roseburia inulinivorans TaxID=360807 RepID=UPI00402759F5
GFMRPAITFLNIQLSNSRGRTVSGGHGIIAQKSISEIVTLHKKLMYYNKNIRGTCNSIHFRYNVLDG